MPIGLASVSVWYGPAPTRFQALRDVSLQIAAGKVTLVMGPSGSGKSSLLSVLGLMRQPDSGSITFPYAMPIATPRERAAARLKCLGFVFQQANLVGSCTALENVLIPALLAAVDKPAALRRAAQLLDELGLAGRHHLRPMQLSGGEAQRVAVCRALVNRPQVVLADEPTAALDAQSGRIVAQQFRRIADDTGTSVVIVTHDPRLMEFSDTTMVLEDGRLVA
jgi:ABC-type lipoprotein export system ATPase subunit